MAAELTIEKIVPEIRSICNSVKEQIEIRRMSNDFAEMMGYEIPWLDFGFDSLKSFLKSRPDDFWLQENAFGEVFVEVVAKEKSEHIVKMVSVQRDSKYVQASKLFSNFSYQRTNFCKTITRSPPRRPLFRPKSPRYDRSSKYRPRRKSCYVSSPSRYTRKTPERSYHHSESRRRESIPSPEFYKRDRKRHYDYESSSSRYSSTDSKRLRRSSIYHDSVRSTDDKPASISRSGSSSDLRNKIRRRPTIFSENPANDFNIHPEKENKKPDSLKDTRRRDEGGNFKEERSASPVCQKTEPIENHRNIIDMDSVYKDYLKAVDLMKCDSPAPVKMQVDPPYKDTPVPKVSLKDPRMLAIKENCAKTNRWDLTPEAMVEYKKQITNFPKIDWDDPNNFLGNQKLVNLNFDFQKELEEYKKTKNGAIEFNYKSNENGLNSGKLSKRTINFWYLPVKISLPENDKETAEKPGYPGFAQSTPKERTPSSIYERPSFGNLSEIRRMDSSSSDWDTQSENGTSTKSATESYSAEFRSWYNRTQDTYLGWKIRNGKIDTTKPYVYPHKFKYNKNLAVHSYAIPKSKSITVDTRPVEIIPDIAKELDKDFVQIKNATKSYIEYIQDLQQKKEIPKLQPLPKSSFKIPKIRNSRHEEKSTFVQFSSGCQLPRRLSISSMASDLSQISINSNSTTTSKKLKKDKFKEVQEEKQKIDVKAEKVAKRTRKSKKNLEKANSTEPVDVVEVELRDEEEVEVKPEVETFKIEPLKYKIAARELDRNIISKVNMLTSNTKSAQTIIKMEKMKRHPVDCNENINLKLYKVVKTAAKSLTTGSLEDLYVTIYKLTLPHDYFNIIMNEPALFQITEIDGVKHVSAK